MSDATRTKLSRDCGNTVFRKLSNLIKNSFFWQNAQKSYWDGQTKTHNSEIKELERRKKEFEKNNAFISALEWRFEFPEVLDDKGIYIGFDVIIANPLYMRIQEIEATQPIQKTIYENQYKTLLELMLEG